MVSAKQMEWVVNGDADCAKSDKKASAALFFGAVCVAGCGFMVD